MSMLNTNFPSGVMSLRFDVHNVMSSNHSYFTFQLRAVPPVIYRNKFNIHYLADSLVARVIKINDLEMLSCSR